MFIIEPSLQPNALPMEMVMQNTLHVWRALGNGEESPGQTRLKVKLLVALIQTVVTAVFGVQLRSILMEFTKNTPEIGVIAI